jgi:hypothetical protein
VNEPEVQVSFGGKIFPKHRDRNVFSADVVPAAYRGHEKMKPEVVILAVSICRYLFNTPPLALGASKEAQRLNIHFCAVRRQEQSPIRVSVTELRVQTGVTHRARCNLFNGGAAE